MKHMVRVTMTAVVEYELDTADYDFSIKTPQQALNSDLEAMTDDHDVFFELWNSHTTATFKGELI